MAYTEFYCQNGGSNLNAGSTNNNSPVYSSIHGNWVNATGVFTPTDGSTPASTVSVGMFASVYIDGASVGVYIGRISVVAAGVNGAITANTAPAGAKPANQTGTATIVVGGAWQGPNAASGFPFTLTSFGNNQDATAHIVRVNLKNDQTYTVTASFAPSTGGSNYVVQGYSSSLNDGGKAIFDGTTSTGSIITTSGPAGSGWYDLKFTTSIGSGTSDLVTTTQPSTFIRCVCHGARRLGLLVNTTSGAYIIECEFYDNGVAGSGGGIQLNNVSTIIRSFSHDNAGSGAAGIRATGIGTVIQNCIVSSNDGVGISFSSSTGGVVESTEMYNNGSDGLNIASTGTDPLWIENCNFIKNVGAAINNVSVHNTGFVYNCGYGAGTQANGSADTLNNLVQSGTVTYGSNLTPWVDPANGDFSINLAAAKGTGRGAFTETDSGLSAPDTVGYPDIGAAQAQAVLGEVSYGFA